MTRSNGRDSGRLPAYAGMGAFTRALQQLITQPRKGRDWLPVVLLCDPEAGGTADSARIAPGLDRWLGGAETPLTRYAYVPARAPGDGPLTMIDTMARQLREITKKRDEGRLGLPGLWFLATVARAPDEARADLVRPRALRDHCYARYRESSPVADALWRLAGGPADGEAASGGLPALLWHGASAWLFQWLPRWWFGVSLRRRLGWFRRWGKEQLGQARKGPFSLFAYAQELVPEAGTAELDGERQEELYRALAQALLTDLERAVRGGRLNPWRRRRATRFVLVFERAGDKDSWEQQFVREARASAARLGATSTLILACGVGSLADQIEDETATGLGRAADKLSAALHEAPRQSGLVVRLPAGPAEDESAAFELKAHPKIVVPESRFGPTTELVASLASGALACAVLAVAATVGPFPLGDDDHCGKNTILGTDGSCVGIQEADSAVNEDVAAVLKAIEAENERVAEATRDWPAEGRRPQPRTVVYVGTLSGAVEASDPVLGGTLAELRGIALAQRYTNDSALHGERVPLRVMVADAGQRFQDAREVARHIVELAERDSSVVGLIGMGQSRQPTYDALEIFSAAGLPVIGTSGTADELLDHGQHYYQIAPTNSRAAAIMAEFARRGELIPDGDGHTTAEVALLVADPRDSYSSDLARGFQEDYPEARTLLYSPVDGGRRDEGPAVEGEIQQDARELARTVCDAVVAEPRTVLVWTARGSEIGPFLQELQRQSGRCPELTMLGGDEVTNARISENDPWQAYPGLHLYFVVGGAGPLLADYARGEGASPEAFEFYQRYHQAYDPGDRDAATRALGVDAHPALAWDALRYLAEGVDQAWRATGGSNARLDRDVVQGVLYQGLGEGGFDGATGRVDSSAVTNDRRTHDKLTIIVRAEPEGEITATLVCGAITQDLPQRTWGPDRSLPCPVTAGQ
ncbi:ABC transporter substrate-binding protein [Streptomyces litchfieldiae]|uniref:ABC transporter substrate-binding protein n=1 Tax=Streptomyces litchfieldiae TaxID=3075543 RepID=A0ABU2MQU1_9ACTN|nr:ABC transporter substrate-binding protein [Streptomyces sp. DSM 44938]MDT0344000.1 ABC transporter substrate-binding protein [Streptomyces sp. DSM 44938]